MPTPRTCTAALLLCATTATTSGPSPVQAARATATLYDFRYPGQPSHPCDTSHISAETQDPGVPVDVPIGTCIANTREQGVPELFTEFEQFPYIEFKCSATTLSGILSPYRLPLNRITYAG